MTDRRHRRFGCRRREGAIVRGGGMGSAEEVSADVGCGPGVIIGFVFGGAEGGQIHEIWEVKVGGAKGFVCFR